MSAPPFSLRPAVAADQAAILALVHAARINPSGIDWPRFIVAADDHGTVIGCGLSTRPLRLLYQSLSPKF